jgi:hypothetical protein
LCIPLWFDGINPGAEFIGGVPWVIQTASTRLTDLLQIFSAMTFARRIRNRAAIAVRSAGADIFSFQTDHFYLFSATAFIRVRFAELTGTIGAATAENAFAFLNSQNVHPDKVRSAFAFARFIGNKVAFAVILTVADVIRFAFICRNKHSNYRKQEKQARGHNNSFFHRVLLF